MRRPAWIIAALLVLGLWLWSQQRSGAPAAPVALPDTGALPAPGPSPSPVPEPARRPDFLPLPAEAHAVLERIAAGGPYEYRQDGSVFQNRERRLPPQPRGYYREYTVETPGSDDRGARRIVTGGQPPREYWYTDDHYRSFRRFQAGSTETAR